MLRLLVAIALVACSAHNDPAPPPPKVPVLPDSITNQLGNGDLALITEGQEPPHAGEPSAELYDLLAKVPRTAKGWFVALGIPAYRMRNIIAWLDLMSDGFQITLQFDSTTRDEAGVEAARVVEGFKEAARGNGVKVEDSWFDIKSTPTSASVVAKLPIAAFGAAAK